MRKAQKSPNSSQPPATHDLRKPQGLHQSREARQPRTLRQAQASQPNPKPQKAPKSRSADRLSGPRALGGLDSSRSRYWGLAALIFAGMLLLNHWTPYVADDFAYMNRWDTYTPLTGLGDVFPSMYAHSFTMNGRLLAHGLEQVFLLLPKTVFNLCSSLVFVGILLTCCRICLGDRPRSCGLLVLFFGGLWISMPRFGEVCLWQVGALNYLWSLGALLILLSPFLRAYTRPQAPLPLWRKLTFLPLAFLAGSYGEIASLIGILTALALTVLVCLERRSGRTWLWLPLLFALGGFACLIRMPAESLNKSGSLELNTLLKNMVTVTGCFQERFLPLAGLWAALGTLALLRRLPKKRLILSTVFFLAGTAATYELIAGSYVAERCLCVSTLLLLLADGILIQDLVQTDLKRVLHPAAAVVTLIFAFSLTAGALDVRDCKVAYTLRELDILAQKASGVQIVQACPIRSATEYSPFYDLRDLDMEDPYTWPNKYMAQYYGVEVLEGVWSRPYQNPEQ